MADKLYFMIRDLYAIHTNVLKRQKEQIFQQEQMQQQQHQQQQQQRQIQQQQRQQQQQQQMDTRQQQEQQLQQQYQLTEQQQQLLLPQQQLPPQYNQLDLPVAGSSNSLQDWTLTFFSAALADGPADPNYAFANRINTNHDLSIETANLFQFSDGFDQTMFPSAASISPQPNHRNDVNNNSM